MISRLSSEFEEDKNKRNIKDFILNSDIEMLSKYFITQELKDLYVQIVNEGNTDNNPKIEEFIKIRTDLMQAKELEFIENFISSEK